MIETGDKVSGKEYMDGRLPTKMANTYKPVRHAWTIS
jgi:hypothetical protein